MGFQDAALLPSRASCSAIFLIHCGGGEAFWTTTCLKTVVLGRHGHVICKILSVQQILFFASVKFHRDHRYVAKLG